MRRAALATVYIRSIIALPNPEHDTWVDARHQPREVVGHNLVDDRLLEARDDELRRFLPAHVDQHHFGGQDLRPGLT